MSHSACPLDCPDRCSLDVSVNDGRVSLRGNSKNPLTAGYICAKVADFPERVHGPRRVLRPAVRVGPKGGGAWREVSWDEALSRITEKFQAIVQRHGPEAILPVAYHGSNGYLSAGGMDARFWNRLGASRPLGTLCAANAAVATRTVYPGLASSDVSDIAYSRLIIVWGCNPSASGIHLVPIIRKAQRAGARLVVIDPVRTPLAAAADLHLAPTPGQDLALALGLHHLALHGGLADQAFLTTYAADADRLAEQVQRWTPEQAGAVAGVDPQGIRQLADWIATTHPTMFRVGWGLERTRNGVDATRAVVALPAVYGRFGRRGGGYVLSTSGGYRGDLSAVQHVGPTPPARSYNLSQLGRALEELQDPPAEAAFIYNNNPVATVPDQARVVRALSRESLFVVVHEQVWTDSCALADIVLPATTFLEHHELTRSYASFVFQWSEPAIPPVGESWSNHRLFATLARLMGFQEPEFDEDEVTLGARILDGFPAGRGAFAELSQHKVKLLPKPVQFSDAFPSAPVQLATPPYTLRPPPAQPELPLILISPATTRAISSTGYETLAPDGARLWLHPDDATARHIRDGQRVKVQNQLGELEVVVEVTGAIRPGVVLLPKGLWRSATASSWTSNVLIPDHVAEVGLGACYNDARVEVTGV